MENPNEVDDPALQGNEEGGHIAGGEVPMDAGDILINGEGDDIHVEAVQPNGPFVQQLGGGAAHIPGGQVAVNGVHVAGGQVPMNAADIPMNGDGHGVQVEAVPPNGPVVQDLGLAHIPGGQAPLNGGEVANGGEFPNAGGHDNVDGVEVDAVPQIDQDLGGGNVAAVPPNVPIVEDHEGNILHGLQAIIFAAAALVTHHCQEMLGICDMLNELGLDLQVDGTALNEFPANFDQHALNSIEQTLAQIQDTLANLIGQAEQVNEAAEMLENNLEQEDEILGEEDPEEENLEEAEAEVGLGEEDPEEENLEEDPEEEILGEDPEEEILGEDPEEEHLEEENPEEENLVEEEDPEEENLVGEVEPGEGGQENNDINALIDAGHTIINASMFIRDEVELLGATAAAAMNNFNLQVPTILTFLAQMDDSVADIQNAAAIAAQARANILAEGNEVQGINLQAGHNLQPVELPQADHGDLPPADQPQAVHPGNIVAEVPQGHLPEQVPENPPVELPEAGHGDLPDAGLPQAVPEIELANLPQGHLPGQLPENPPLELPEAGHGDLPDAGQPQVVQPGIPQGHQLGQLPDNHDGRVINGEVHHGDDDEDD